MVPKVKAGVAVAAVYTRGVVLMAVVVTGAWVSVVLAATPPAGAGIRGHFSVAWATARIAVNARAFCMMFGLVGTSCPILFAPFKSHPLTVGKLNWGVLTAKEWIFAQNDIIRKSRFAKSLQFKT